MKKTERFQLLQSTNTSSGIADGRILLKCPQSFKFKGKSTWKVHRNRKCLVLVLTYSLLSIFLFTFLHSKVYPKHMDCPIYNNVNLTLKSQLTAKLEKSILKFCKNYSDQNLERGWTEMTHNIFVYSAYIDTCPFIVSPSLSSCVLFIGVTLTNTSAEGYLSSSSISCAIKKDSEVKYAGFAFTEILPENHSKMYSAAFFYCDLKGFLKDASWPKFATLYKTNISTWIPVQLLATNNITPNITTSLCVRPLYGSYSSVDLSEFLAYYSMMGVKHFIFYKQDISDSKFAFLKFLEEANLSMEILSWNLPFNNVLIHEYGQMVFTQDCILRSKYKFSHTIIADFDEYIVPKFHPTIYELIFYLDKKYENAGSYTIQMVMFCAEFLNKTQNSPFTSIKSNKRQKTPWYHGFRSKYILKPDRVYYAGIHSVWKHVEGWREIQITDSTALLHHYRHCCGVTQSWFFHLFNYHVLNDEVVTDNTFMNHASKVMNHTLVTFILSLTNLTSNKLITTAIPKIF